MIKRNDKGQFIKENHISTEFKKGNPPPKHKKGCKCFRCSHLPWNKNKKMSKDFIEKVRQRNLNMPKVVRKKIRNTLKKLWQNPEYKKQMRRVHLGQRQPEFDKSSSWKGDKVGYRALHNWVEKVLGKPKVCQNCGKICTTRNSIHWANKTGKYLRDISDWLRLCVKCHKKHDKFLSSLNPPNSP